MIKKINRDARRRTLINKKAHPIALPVELHPQFEILVLFLYI